MVAGAGIPGVGATLTSKMVMIVQPSPVHRSYVNNSQCLCIFPRDYTRLIKRIVLPL